MVMPEYYSPMEPSLKGISNKVNLKNPNYLATIFRDGFSDPGDLASRFMELWNSMILKINLFMEENLRTAVGMEMGNNRF